MITAIRSILKEHASLAAPVDSLSDDADLYAAGLTSHATVNVMLALEDHFGLEFPERMMRRRSFESVTAIRSAIEQLNGRAAS
jgi:acyl carrier protein